MHKQNGPAAGDAADEAGIENAGRHSDTTTHAVKLDPVGPVFDYGSLPAEIRNEAKIIADEIKRRMRDAVIEVGAVLARIKDRLPHGQFGEWLSAEFGMTERTAQNYMAAAALAAKYETVSVLPAGSLYLLAAPSTPEPARHAVIERLGRGEAPSAKAIKTLIADAKYERREEQRRSARKTRKRQAAPPISKAGAAFYAEHPAPPPMPDLDELKSVLAMLRGDPGRIANLSIEKRTALACTCLAFLNLTVADLRDAAP
jgi:hypothetical protein